MKIIKKVLFWLSIVLLATAAIAPTTQVEARGGHGGGHGGSHGGGSLWWFTRWKSFWWRFSIWRII